MKFLFDLLPVILFFGAFKWAGAYPQIALHWMQSLPLLGVGVQIEQAPILLATLVVMLSTALQIAWIFYRHGKVDKMLWASLVLVLLFGGMTLVLHDELFIKWKPTALYWLFAAGLSLALALNKNPLGAMLGGQFDLPAQVWSQVNRSWVAFFIFMGALNLIVAFNFSTDTWVNYKLFGGMGLMLVFIVAQAFFLMRFAEVDDAEQSSTSKLPDD